MLSEELYILCVCVCVCVGGGMGGGVMLCEPNINGIATIATLITVNNYRRPNEDYPYTITNDNCC